MTTQPISIEATEQRELQAVSEQRHTLTAFNVQEHAWVNLLQHLPHCKVERLVYGQVFKRWIDVVAALSVLLVLSPVLVLVALLIRLDLGSPVVFRQKRVGKHGQPFVIYKFRTMIPDRRRNRSPYASEADRRVSHKTRHDPRVTRLGHFLRRTSLDELPQLWNVLRGDMSLIGPRPELPDIVERYAPWQHMRHLVRPGLSGWWQIHGRSDRPMHEHTELDIYYVVNQSFCLDVRIVVRTIGILMRRSGAF